MERQELEQIIRERRSVLCVGLDTDIAKIPRHLLEEEDPLFSFNKAIIDATHPYAVAYKPNLAFYEAEGLEGWRSLEKTLRYLQEHYPRHFTIADAKRGDIGNTSERYARAFFEKLDFDALTVAPYMGSDSVTPFLKFPGKWVALLALTSNVGATDFQFLAVDQQLDAAPEKLYQRVLRQSKDWAGDDKMMYVVGATRPDYLTKVRQIVPDHFLLIPGVGAQGGNLEAVLQHGAGRRHPAMLINAARSIIYKSDAADFAEAAAHEAASLQGEMARLLAL